MSVFDLGVTVNKEGQSVAARTPKDSSNFFKLITSAQQGHGSLWRCLSSFRISISDFVDQMFQVLGDGTKSDTLKTQSLQLLAEHWEVLLQSDVQAEQGTRVSDLIKLVKKQQRKGSKRTAKQRQTPTCSYYHIHIVLLKPQSPYCGALDVQLWRGEKNNLFSFYSSSFLLVQFDGFSWSILVRNQFFVCITTLMICTDYFKHSPLRFHQFIESHLLSTIGEEDKPRSVLLRITACECLIQLEESYPCIFSTKLGQFQALAAKQRTVAAQAYVHLVSVTFHNIVHVLSEEKEVAIADAYEKQQQQQHQQHQKQHKKKSSTGEKRTTTDKDTEAEGLPKFIKSVPENLRSVSKLSLENSLLTQFKSLYFPLETRLHPLVLPPCHIFQRMQFKYEVMASAVSSILKHCEVLTDVTALHVLTKLVVALRRTTHSHKMLKIVLHRLETSMSVCGLHTLLVFLSVYRSIKLLHRRDITNIRLRVLDLISDPQVDEWKKLLLMHLSFSDKTLLGKVSSLLPFLPREFESLPMWQRKIDMLAYSIGLRLQQQNEGTSDLSEHSDGKSVISETSTLHEVIIDTGDGFENDIATLEGTLENSLACFNSYTKKRSSSPAALQLYRTLFNMFLSSNVDPRFLCGIVLDITLNNPGFVPLTVDLVSSVRTATNKQDTVSVLASLVERVVSLPPMDAFKYIDEYLALILSVASIPTIPPSSYLMFINELLMKTSLGRQGEWVRGYRLLQICHRVMRVHAVSDLARSLPLGDVLMSLWHGYRNIDIKDQARFYYSLLTNVSSTTRTPLLNISIDSYKSFQEYCPEEAMRDHTSVQKNMIKKVQHKLLALTRLNTASMIRDPNNHIRKRGVSSKRPVFQQIPQNDGLLSTLDGDAVLLEYATNLAESINTLPMFLECEIAYEVSAGVVKVAQCPEHVYSIEIVFSEIASGSLDLSSTTQSCDVTQALEQKATSTSQSSAHEPINRIPSQTFRSLPTVFVPTLSRRVTTSVPPSPPVFTSSQKEKRFNIVLNKPHTSSWRFAAECIPTKPCSTLLNAKVKYTDGNGQSWEGMLDTIRVEFSDFMQEAPYPTHWMESVIEEGRGQLGSVASPREWSISYKQKLFGALWKHHTRTGSRAIHTSRSLSIRRDTAIESITALFKRFIVTAMCEGDCCGDEKENGCNENDQDDGDLNSTTTSTTTEVEADDVVRKSTSVTVSSPSADNNNSSRTHDCACTYTVHCLVFVPPQYHVLLKFTVESTYSVVEWVSDNPVCVVEMDKLLDSISANPLRAPMKTKQKQEVPSRSSSLINSTTVSEEDNEH
eukprot:m.57674 g.57674  ORF g.57674 m.57674 type:complete len:1304 (-) comp11242_c0_seq5:1546-5457(-)